METIQNCDIKKLIDVLSQGNDHIMELEAQLHNYHPFTSEACKLLSSKVQSAFATAITMTNKLIEQGSLRSPSESPRSENSERDFKEHERREMCKKRKSLPRWRGQVQACSASAMEMPIDDGYSWRKYGQKDILGAKFPRCYYRCSHRHSHGCIATKQVQRSEDHSSFFDITYRGAHTCNTGLQKNPVLSPEEQSIHENQPPKTEQQQQLLQIFRTGLKVKTEEGLSSDDLQPGSSSTPVSCLKPESNVFSSASKPENNYYSTMTNYVDLDSEIADIFFASTSTTSSQMVGMDFGVEQLVFDGDFSFDFC